MNPVNPINASKPTVTLTRRLRSDLVFAQRGNPVIKDAVVEVETASGTLLVGAYGGKTQAELAAEGYTPWATYEFTLHQEELLTTLPSPISEECFQEALNCLPPAWWRMESNTESFHMSEFYSGRITRHYVRLGRRHFTFLSRPLQHHEALDKVREWVYAGVAAISAGPTCPDTAQPWKVEGTHPQGNWVFTASSEKEVMAIYNEYKRVG